MKWLNALGMFFQFISFWLAAPELIGDAGLKRLNSFLKKLVSNLSIILLTILILGYALFFSINGILRGIRASEFGLSYEEISRYYINFAIGTVFYIVFLIKFKKIKLWLDLKIAIPLVNKFTYNDNFRKNSLIAGALLFTFGFLIQFILVLLQS